MTVTLVTGGAGFIGSNLVRLLLEETDRRIINLDKLTYAGNRSTIMELEGHSRHRFIQGDITDAGLVERLFAEEGIEEVMNLAAESHVDRSIDGPSVFVQTNVVGTQVLLEAARRHGVRRYLQVSTDEVYGSLGRTGFFTEDSPIAPSSPYSASKASADLLVQAWHHTYGLPACITRCSNNYGPWQYPEKLIPVMIGKALANQPLPVYGDGTNVRDWIHVEDHNRALLRVLENGEPGRVYNIGAENERSNLDIVRTLLKILDRPESLISFVKDRPGHDWRYAIDPRRVQTELGWQPRRSFEQGLEETVRWYLDHREWWQPLAGSA